MRRRHPTILVMIFSACVMARAGEAPADQPKTCLAETGEIANQVNGWYAAGEAAGNSGDFYDNRDRGHSLLNLAPFPQLRQIPYSEAELSQRQDWGLTVRVRPQVTIGNSSTASSVADGGSNPRHMYVSGVALAGLYAQYRGNNLYIYPEHRDYDPGHNGVGDGFGDLYPTNSPYLVISQGSSFSDQVFLQAFVKTLAAFRPETKRRLVEQGLLMPTLQLIFRSSNRQVHGEEDYLSGKAHPTVFQGPEIDAAAMVKRAHDLMPDALPPLALIKAIREDEAVAPRDHFDIGRSEHLCDTPCVIGRVFRRLRGAERIVVSAKDSIDPQGQALEYRWVVLHGDPDRIAITTSEQGAVAEIVVRYQPRRPIAPGSRMESNRVDIGVFARNASSYSAPAFVTVFFPDNELRTYDAQDRLIDIGYAGGDTRIGNDGSTIMSFAPGCTYPITDWSAVLALLQGGGGELGARLLRARFSAPELEALGRIATRYERSRTAKLAEWQATAASTAEKAQLADAAQKDVDQARKAADAKTPEADAKKEELQRLEKILNTARNDANQAKWKRDALPDEPIAILTRVDQALGMSAKARIEQALNALEDDPGLYVQHLDELQPLIEAAKADQAVADHRARLADFGILAEGAGGQWAITSALGSGSPQRLTACEAFELRRFHLYLLSHVLFPGFLRCEPTRNYTDERLARVRDCREVYRYGDDGRLLGWTRYQGGPPEEFTADGWLVTAKDPQGRPLRIRQAKQVLECRYRDDRAGGQAAGWLRFDGESVGVYDAQDQVIVDPAAEGKGLRPEQVQFLVFESPAPDPKQPPYVVDVNHYRPDGEQTGWTRHDHGAVLEFTRHDAATFTATDANGRAVGEGKLKYEVPRPPGTLKLDLIGEERDIAAQNAAPWVGGADPHRASQ